MDSDSDYFAKRASDERAAATRATSNAARNVHLVLAGRYEDLATSIVDHMTPIMNPGQPANDRELPAEVQSAFSYGRPRLTVVARSTAPTA